MITLLSAQFGVKELCGAFGLSRSGYYSHHKKDQRVRRLQDRELAPKIEKAFLEGRKAYGTPRIQRLLHAQGLRHGKNRIARLMKQLGLRAAQKKRFRPRTTHSNHRLPVANNWVAKVPSPDKPNQIWLADITYIPTQQGWLYLAGVLDAYSRKIIGWKIQDSMETSLVTEALEKALVKRKPLPGLLHHSDRGSQYASGDFQSLLAKSKICCSMSRAGNCYDNAPMESFWATLKTECFQRSIPKNKEEANLIIFDYIESFYNSKRLHSSLDFKSPMDFEKQFN